MPLLVRRTANKAAEGFHRDGLGMNGGRGAGVGGLVRYKWPAIRVDGARFRPSVLLITVDTLRRDHVWCTGSNKTMIEELAEEGIVFDNAITPFPNRPAHSR